LSNLAKENPGIRKHASNAVGYQSATADAQSIERFSATTSNIQAISVQHTKSFLNIAIDVSATWLREFLKNNEATLSNLQNLQKNAKKSDETTHVLAAVERNTSVVVWGVKGDDKLIFSCVAKSQ